MAAQAIIKIADCAQELVSRTLRHACDWIWWIHENLAAKDKLLASKLTGHPQAQIDFRAAQPNS